MTLSEGSALDAGHMSMLKGYYSGCQRQRYRIIDRHRDPRRAKLFMLKVRPALSPPAGKFVYTSNLNKTTPGKRTPMPKNLPVTRRALPSLQLCYFVDLEAKNLGHIFLRLGSGISCRHVTTHSQCRVPSISWRLFSHTTQPPWDSGAGARRGPGEGCCSTGRSCRSTFGRRFTRYHVRIDHEEHVRKGRAKVSSVDRTMPTGLGRVEIFTSWTVKLDGLFVGKVGETAR